MATLHTLPQKTALDDNDQYDAAIAEAEEIYRALSYQERRFVEIFLSNGNAKTAALQAGYPEHIAMMASTLMNRSHIRRALRAGRETMRETRRQTDVLGSQAATEVLLSMMLADRETPASVRAQIAMRLADKMPMSASREFEGDLVDDSAMEQIEGRKAMLALIEAQKTDDVDADDIVIK